MGKDVGVKEKGLNYGAMSAHEAFRILVGYTTMKQNLTLIW